MNSLSADRLAGVIAGALLLRALESLNGIVIQLTMSADKGAAASSSNNYMAGAVVVLAALGYGYLQTERKPWLDRVTFIVLSLTLLVAVSGSFLTTLVETETTRKYRGMMIASVLTQAVIAALLLAAVVWLRSKERARRPSPAGMPAGGTGA